MQKENIVLVDAGTGNLFSVYQVLKQSGADIRISNDARQIKKAFKVILPGVGSFAKFMHGLEQAGLTQVLSEYLNQNRLMLSICVGMQALLTSSEEMGSFSGLGIIPGLVNRLPSIPGLKIPHTGWNQLWFDQPCPILRDINPGSYTYFNHSYYCEPIGSTYTAATSDYGINFSSILRKGNLYAVQFHPEKSQKVGMQILRNFLDLKGDES